jgi:hypothetical protein
MLGMFDVSAFCIHYASPKGVTRFTGKLAILWRGDKIPQAFPLGPWANN